MQCAHYTLWRRILVWCPSTMCLSFDICPVRRLYTALLRFPHLNLVCRGLLCDQCRCVLVQFGHLLALHVAVSPPVPVRILPWSCHTPSSEDATSFLCALWLLFPTKTEFFVWYCSLFWVQCLFQAFKEVKRQFLHLFCVRIHMFVFCVSCFVFFLSVLYYSALLYSSSIQGPIISITIRPLQY